MAASSCFTHAHCGFAVATAVLAQPQPADMALAMAAEMIGSYSAFVYAYTLVAPCACIACSATPGAAVP
eukprot:3709983-Rhodomonas_salina.1